MSAISFNSPANSTLSKANNNKKSPNFGSYRVIASETGKVRFNIPDDPKIDNAKGLLSSVPILRALTDVFAESGSIIHKTVALLTKNPNDYSLMIKGNNIKLSVVNTHVPGNRAIMLENLKDQKLTVITENTIKPEDKETKTLFNKAAYGIEQLTKYLERLMPPTGERADIAIKEGKNLKGRKVVVSNPEQMAQALQHSLLVEGEPTTPEDALAIIHSFRKNPFDIQSQKKGLFTPDGYDLNQSVLYISGEGDRFKANVPADCFTVTSVH